MKSILRFSHRIITVIGINYRFSCRISLAWLNLIYIFKHGFPPMIIRMLFFDAISACTQIVQIRIYNVRMEQFIKGELVGRFVEV